MGNKRGLTEQLLFLSHLLVFQIHWCRSKNRPSICGKTRGAVSLVKTHYTGSYIPLPALNLAFLKLG
jgi:hypothetical protein